MTEPIILIPAYNAEKTIAKVVLKARKYGIVLVCDDGSEDMTGEIAGVCGADVYRQSNMGKGGAFKTLFERIPFEDRIIVTMDSDDQHDADEIPNLIEPIVTGIADVVIGQRSNRTVPRQIVSKFLDLYTSDDKLDGQSGFRAYSPKAFSKVEVRSSGFAVDQQILEDMLTNKMRIIQIPVLTKYDEESHTKFSVSHFTELLDDILYRHPLSTFCTFGSFSIGGGLFLFYNVIDSWNINHELALGKMLFASLFTIIGVVTIFSGLMIHVLVKNIKERNIVKYSSDPKVVKGLRGN